MLLKKRITKIIFILLVAFAVKLKAQQLPQYTNYMLNNYVLNPAVGGIDPYFIGVSTNRYQWAGITDAPRTYIMSVNGPTKSLKVGIGGTVYTDIVGPTRRVGFTLSYSYHFEVTKKIKLALGLSGGLTQFKVDGSQIQLKDPSDIVITNGVQQLTSPDFGFGFHLYSAKKTWYIGGSIPQMLQSQIRFDQISTSSSSTLARHYFLTGGYKFYITDQFKVEPSFLLQYVPPVPAQINLGLRFIYRNKFWIGGLYRSQDAASILLGYSTNKDIVFMYSYDFTTSAIGKYSSGTNEILIGIIFNRKKSVDISEDNK
jgi:type IX secretion system PorP/SprF family membrane protein